MGITVFIPARGGSKGIVNKNITLVLGKPLIYWVCSVFEKSNNISKIVVATDSPKIKSTVKTFNFSKLEVFDRSKKNATDYSKSIDVVLEYINTVNLPDDEIFCLGQATAPLLRVEDVDNSILLFNTSNANSVFGCVKLNRICWTMDGRPIMHDIFERKRRQDSDGILVENGAIYLTKVKNIKDNKSLFSVKNNIPYIMPSYTITEIDELDDIEVVEKALRKNLSISYKDYKILLLDCDGVLTDGGMYYTNIEEKMKKFNTNDAFGIKKLKDLGYYIAIITGEKSSFAKIRANKLNIDCYSGVIDKFEIVKQIAKKQNAKLSEIIYMGDDENDYVSMMNVGYAVCPNNAQKKIKNISNYQTKLNGGNGAVREFIEFLLAD